MSCRMPLLRHFFDRGKGKKNLKLKNTTVWQVLSIHESHFVQDGYVCVQALRQACTTEHNVFVLGLKCALKTSTMHEAKKMIIYLKEYLQEQLVNHSYFKHYVVVTFHPNAKALREGTGSGMYRVLMNDQQISGITPLLIRLMHFDAVGQVCIRNTQDVTTAALMNNNGKITGTLDKNKKSFKDIDKTKNNIFHISDKGEKNVRHPPLFGAFKRYALRHANGNGSNSDSNFVAKAKCASSNQVDTTSSTKKASTENSDSTEDTKEPALAEEDNACQSNVSAN